jgi:signal transduction histidine kinase
MTNETGMRDNSPLVEAVVFDHAAGTTSHGVVLAPIDTAGQNARLTSAGLMSAGIAHDLGNLMQIIEAGMRGMERRFGHETSPELRFLGQEVRGAAARASVLTRRMLDYARDGGEPAAEVDVGAVVAQMRALIGWAAGPSVQVIVEIESGLPATPCVRSDLESAIINLVINARQAMPEGGALTLSVCGHGGDVMLRVVDTGCGMSPEAVRRACEPFVTSRSESGGCGLGLAIVSAFVRSVRGAIRIESAVGRGTAIMLLFRAAEDAC